MTCALNERTVQLGGLHADRFPREVIAGAYEAGLAHTTAQLRIVEDTHQAISHRFLKGARIKRGSRAILLLFDRHEVAGLSVDNHVGNAAGCGTDDGQTESHRLQVHNTEGFVDGRSNEHLSRGQDRCHLGLREHLGNEDDAGASGTQVGDEALNLGSNFRGIGGASAQDQLDVLRQELGGAQEVRQALLTGNTADEDDRATRRVNTVLGEHAGTQFLSCFAFGRVPLVQVNAVVDDVHSVGINAGVAAQDIVAHTVRHRDNRAGGLIGGCLHIGRQAVTTAELLSLPGAQRLERVGGDDMGDVAQQRGHVASEVRVPRVRVDEVRPLTCRGDLEVYAQGAQGRVRSSQLRQVGMAGHSRVGTITARLARTVKRLHPQVIDQPTQNLCQFKDVNASASVDVGRVFAGKQIDAHDGVLPTVATRSTHRIRSHVTTGRKRDDVAIDRHL